MTKKDICAYVCVYLYHALIVCRIMAATMMRKIRDCKIKLKAF